MYSVIVYSHNIGLFVKIKNCVYKSKQLKQFISRLQSLVFNAKTVGTQNLKNWQFIVSIRNVYALYGSMWEL